MISSWIDVGGDDENAVSPSVPASSSSTSSSTVACANGLVGRGLATRPASAPISGVLDVRRDMDRLLSRRRAPRAVELSDRAESAGDGGARSGRSTDGSGARQ